MEKLSGSGPSGNDMTKFTLRCDVDRNRLWRCEADIDMRLLNANGGVFSILNKRASYHLILYFFSVLHTISREPTND